MARAILKFDEKELTVGEDATSFGRTTENTVAFPDNSNISRNHARIEFKDGKFVVTDLGSSNGTTVNGQKTEGETALNDGDFITLGNSVIVEFIIEDDTPENAGDDSEMVESSSIPEAVSANESKSNFPLILGITGAVCGLAVVFAVAATFVYFAGKGGSACDATARITSPANGETISQETEIKVDVKNSACVSTVHVLLNEKEIAALTEEPYAAQLDPKNFPELSDGGLYGLTVVLEDAEGNKIPQGRDIALQFETKEITAPTPTSSASATPTPEIASGKQPTLIDVQKMTAATVRKFTGGSFKYNLSNPEFLAEVRKRTAEYSSSEGYFARAAAYRDVINQSFVRDKALDAALPYALAMSRSKFNLEKQGDAEGLWQMSNEFATVNAYNAICTTPNLSDPAQDCAAKAAALYMEDLVVKTFDGDIIFAVASFGKPAQAANEWKAGLPADRSDFWKVITDAAQREQVARFFAAAIVAENPQKFGLKKERPISELYPAGGAR
ncbi:MAG TPA: FHA domain-containing protein [Pyrinomonadaceae bacterium]|jgi:pSer/pThr/pTyr-binding forkhead associated (FHA) protein